jgi:hypothetical protein
MKIKMLVNVTDASGCYPQGQVVHAPKAAALRLVDRGRAILTDESAAETVSTETGEGPPELESAALGEPGETAAEPAPRRKRKSS